MKFDAKEDAIVRRVKLYSTPVGDGDLEHEPRTVFRVSMSDGAQFAVAALRDSIIKPKEIAEALINMGERILKYYYEEDK